MEESQDDVGGMVYRHGGMRVGVTDAGMRVERCRDEEFNVVKERTEVCDNGAASAGGGETRRNLGS